MAEVIWTTPALSDLDAIADYIAIENPNAAKVLVRKVFKHVSQLAEHPASGPRPPELPDSRYRQITEPPCRIFYRAENDATVYIIHVMRDQEQLLPEKLTR